jgi:hypothetical protein
MSRRLLPLFAVIELVMRAGSPWTTCERMVAICLANHMDGDGEAWPSARRIRECTGLSKTRVRAALRALCSGSEAVFECLKRGIGRETGRYRLAERSTRRTSEVHQANLRGPRRAPQRSTSRASEVHVARAIEEQPIEQPIEHLTEFSTPVGAEASAWSNPKAKKGRRGKAEPAGLVRPPSWSREACDDWIAGTGGTAPGGRLAKALRPLVDRYTWEVLRPDWQRFCAAPDSRYGPEQFTNHYGLWSNGRNGSGKLTLSERNEQAGIEWLEEQDRGVKDPEDLF